MSKARGLADLGNAYSDGALSNRNVILNGAMNVAQRGTSSSPAPVGYLIDRFATFKSGGGAYSVAQSTDAPVGFSHSMLVTVTSASTPSGGDYYLTQQVIEGYNASVLSLGTSNAQEFTLSFYVKSSLTGTFSGTFRDGVEALTYAFEYTVDTANTWERKTVTIAGTSSGTFPTNNTASLKLCFSLGQGSTYATSTVGSWVSGSYHGSTTETDLIASAGATWQITGVQLEVGDTATPFEHRSFGQELALCQRYYKPFLHEVRDLGAYGNNRKVFKGNHHPAMRSSPSITQVGNLGNAVFNDGHSGQTTGDEWGIHYKNSLTNVGGWPLWCHSNCVFDAEL